MNGPILIMQAGGGLAEATRVVDVAVQTIGSGRSPASPAPARFGAQVDNPNVICTDMGGTTFDVGLVVDGAPIRRSSSILQQFEYSLPQVDVRSDRRRRRQPSPGSTRSPALRVGPAERRRRPRPGLLRPRRHARRR